MTYYNNTNNKKNKSKNNHKKSKKTNSQNNTYEPEHWTAQDWCEWAEDMDIPHDSDGTLYGWDDD